MNPASSSGLSVRYDEGFGPLIVMLHGINSDASDWRPVIDRIGARYRCIAIDLLGFGESPKPLDVDYSADDHARAVAKALDELGVTERFVLVGYSLGGDVAIRFAATHPDRVRRLVLVSTPFYLPAESLGRQAAGPRYLAELAYQAVWRAVAGQKQRGGAAYTLASGRFDEFAKGFLRTDDVSTHWDIMAANLTNTIAATTIVEDLPALTMPVVFLIGLKDVVVRPDQVYHLKRLKPDIDVRRVSGPAADHFMLLNLPERVADEILADEVERLHVAWRSGAGTPTVLLHSIEHGADRWQPFATGLAAAGHDVAVLDLLGFGGSPVPLSSRFTVEDHAAAVLGTLGSLWGERPVRLIGHGFGALVALACTAERPAQVLDVTAFSPALVPPGVPVDSLAENPAVARALAARTTLARLAEDERARALGGERLERRIVPLSRSWDAVLATDAAALLGQVRCATRWVLPTDTAPSPWAWLEEAAADRPGDTVTLVDGPADLCLAEPVRALESIGVSQPTALEAAAAAGPVSAAPRRGLVDISDTANRFAVRGALTLLGGKAILSLARTWPEGLFTLWLAGVLGLEALHTLAGSLALRREGKTWVPWLLLGAASAVFSAALVMRDRLGMIATGVVVLGWLAVRGVADLYVAWRVQRLPLQRWALVAEGVGTLSLAIALLVVPEAGRVLLRTLVGGYFVASGASSLLFAWRIHAETDRRIRCFTAGATRRDSAAVTGAPCG